MQGIYDGRCGFEVGVGDPQRQYVLFSILVPFQTLRSAAINNAIKIKHVALSLNKRDTLRRILNDGNPNEMLNRSLAKPFGGTM